MDSSGLVRWFGFGATLLHGDTLVLDRWRWLKRRLPLTANGETVLDVGCGTGAFTIGAARRGYKATGVSWDERNQKVAQARAQHCRTDDATFIIGDVRSLDALAGVAATYDIVICLECIEHILDDRKLFRDIAARLRPGGRMLLTTPNYDYHPISASDRGPFLTEETGWHVRRGYTAAMLEELCRDSGLVCSDVSYCSGFISQKVTGIWRWVGTWTKGKIARWVVTLPLRPLPIVLADGLVTTLLDWPRFSICLEAYKPRFGTTPADQLPSAPDA